MSFILKRIRDGKFLVEDTDRRRYWGTDIQDAVRYSSSTVAEREASNFDFMDNVKVIGFEEKLPPAEPSPTVDWYLSQASKYLRFADQGSQTEQGIKTSLMYAESAVAMYKLAIAKNQGELF